MDNTNMAIAILMTVINGAQEHISKDNSNDLGNNLLVKSFLTDLNKSLRQLQIIADQRSVEYIELIEPSEIWENRPNIIDYEESFPSNLDLSRKRG